MSTRVSKLALVAVLLCAPVAFAASKAPPPKGAASVEGAAGSGIALSPRVKSRLGAGWKALPQIMRNLTELVHEHEGQRGAHMTVHHEKRRTHAEALGRLFDIANESGGQRSFTTICGWPALERRYRVRIDPPGVAGQTMAPPVDVDGLTVAIAQHDSVVRFEGFVRPGGKSAIEQLLQLARGADCPKPARAADVERSLQFLKSRPLRKGGPGSTLPLPKYPGAGTPLAMAKKPVLAVSGLGELQVTASKDGKNVVVGTNAIFFNKQYAYSNDGGATFQTAAFTAANRGDPSLATGASGAMYLAYIGGGASACTIDVARSTDNGKSFAFAGSAASCPLTGAICFPDQEFIAADPQPGKGDQLYAVWRHFPPGPAATQCSGIGKLAGTYGAAVPTISCSKDGGTTWLNQTAVGVGDRGRVTVGPDGFVYVTYVSGQSLMMHKFSSCETGLQPQTAANFPVQVASYNGVTCPVPGLDRCTPDSEGSPQAAVDTGNAKDVLVAYADQSAAGNDDIVVRQSLDGGATFTKSVIANSAKKAVRFLPWICASKGKMHVTWYDRRFGTASDQSLTRYFWSQVNTAPKLFAAGETDVSGASDSQQSFTSNGSPHYGDYNGNYCAAGKVFMAWASATAPSGVTAAPSGMNVYSFVGDEPAPGAKCPTPEELVLARFARSQDGVGSLPPAERERFANFTRKIAASFAHGCRPLALVATVGHVDPDDTLPGKPELDLSQRRARRVADELIAAVNKLVGGGASSKLRAKVDGLGTTALRHAHPGSQLEHEENRRVVIRASY